MVSAFDAAVLIDDNVSFLDPINHIKSLVAI